MFLPIVHWMHWAESAESSTDIGWLLEELIHQTDLNLTSLAWLIWRYAQFLVRPFSQTSHTTVQYWVSEKSAKCRSQVGSSNKALFQILAAGPKLTFWSQHTWSIRLDGLICLMQRSSHDYANSDPAVSPSVPRLYPSHSATRFPALRL